MKKIFNKTKNKTSTMTGRKIFAALSVTLILMIGALAASAQHGYRVTKRVAFKKGEISTTVKGTIPNTIEAHEYVFRARKGQTVLIDLSSAREDVTFSLMDEQGNSMDEGRELRYWSGELPATRDYHVIINSISERPIRYSLFIQIATDI